MKPFLAAFILLLCASSPMERAAAASFMHLGQLPGAIVSDALGLSADGSTVVGSTLTSVGYVTTKWTATGGPVTLNDSQGLPGRGFATAASGNGSVIVGTWNVTGASSGEAFRWTAAGGIVGLGDLAGGPLNSRTYGVSADGGVVVGQGQTATRKEAFIWSAGGGMTSLGVLPGAAESAARAISADGSIVAGDSGGAFFWTAASGMTAIPALAASKGVAALSADGTVVVGYIWAGTHDEAYRWSASGGLTTLGVFGPMNRQSQNLEGSYASAASADASVIVGTMVNDAGNSAFIWTATAGMRSLLEVLVNDYGLGTALAGWHLSQAYAVSSDGLVLVGSGQNGATGAVESWIADLRPTAVPEPANTTLMAVSLPLIGWAIRRRRGSSATREA